MNSDPLGFPATNGSDASAEAPQGSGPDNHRFVFVIGLHRSGTTLFAELISRHSQASGLSNTGAIMDEGSFLHKVFPDRGSVGAAAFERGMHQTERSTAATPAGRAALWAAWSPYWDLSRPVLVEKSPSHITKTRLLHYFFPRSHFILITRHPLVQGLAISKWARNRAPLQFVTNWMLCHRRFERDAGHLPKWMSIRYEDLCARPQAVMAEVFRFLDLPEEDVTAGVSQSSNAAYLARWQGGRATRLGHLQDWTMRQLYEAGANRWGYSFRSPYDLRA
ncbi:MAG: sulfotransferase [Pikeienuella sp.]